jgi:hypothetical protein
VVPWLMGGEVLGRGGGAALVSHVAGSSKQGGSATGTQRTGEAMV